ncbi:MAG: D-amino acid dehydrogenase [Rhodovibrionaceae bacterium]
MRVAVLGGGVVGVTTAYQLMKDGHEVVVAEAREGAALETSWGNAGMIAPGHAFAWSSPKAPMILLKSLVLRDQALRFRPSADPRLWSWSWQFLQQCTAERARLNTLRKHGLCVYSQAVLHETLEDVEIDYDRVAKGLIYFYRSEETLAAGVAHMQILADDGQQLEVLTRDALLTREPALAGAGGKIAGGIYCPTDETGDCHKFTSALARHCEAQGVEFRFGTEIQAIEGAGDRIARVKTDKGDLEADAYVLSLGNYSPVLARPLRLKLPIYPVKGYSLSIPIGNHRGAPRLGVVDEENLVAIAPLGDRIRATATAEFAGYDTSHKPADFAHMLAVTRELYADGADYERAEHWAGLRPMTPEGTPIFGQSRYRNLYINSGQGHMGWTMSHGSARITADLIAGKQPAIPLEGMTITRAMQ